MEIPINNKYSLRHYNGIFTIFNKDNPNFEKVSLRNQGGKWSFSEIVHNGNKVHGYNGKYNTVEDALRVLGGDMVSTFASKIKEIDRGSGYSGYPMVSRPRKRNSRVRETFYKRPRGLRRFSNKKNNKKRSRKKKRARSRKKR